MADETSCCKRIPIKRGDFGLNWKAPQDFARSQWPIPGWLYQIYRILFMVYIVVWLTMNTAWQIEGIGGLYFIYLTNWSFIVLAFYGIVAALSSVFFFCKGKKRQRTTADASRMEDGAINPSFVADQEMPSGEGNESPKTNRPTMKSTGHPTPSVYEEYSTNPWYFKLTWVLLNINVAIAPLVSIIYWALLHDYSNDDDDSRDPLGDGINVNVHGMNSVLILLDLFVSAYPLRIVHIIYCIIYSLTYALFSLIFWAAGGVDPYGNRYIYPILNWEDIPGLTCAYMLGLAVILFVVQCVMYGLYRLRVFLAGSCCRLSQDRENDTLQL
nr:protein rolling stone-like [Lytechinus pictus]